MQIGKLSRRAFLAAGAAAAGGVVLAARWRGWGPFADDRPRFGAEAMSNGIVDDPTVFIALAEDGSVTLWCHRAEMGQGIKSSLAMVLADELEADWARIRVVQADGDELRYGNQNTDGSRSMRHWYAPMRRCGAAARVMLEEAAAARWGVPAAECRAREHAVHHEASGRQLGYGELAAVVAELEVPDRSRVRLKEPQEFRYIGRDERRSVDARDIVTGAAVYGADVALPDTLVAVIARPPVLGARVAGYDEAAALALPGVEKIVRLPDAPTPAQMAPLGGVAVIARGTWFALKAREALALRWGESPHGAYATEQYVEQLRAVTAQAGSSVRRAGDVDAALAAAAERVEQVYVMPHQAHAPMEPPVATARYADGRCEVWAPVQSPEGARRDIAAALGIARDAVTVHVTLLGGAFGRKSKPDFAVEAALLAREVPGRPLRVQWTREDDLRHDFFHTLAVERLTAGLDASGRVVAYRHRSAAPSIGSLFNAEARRQSGGEMAQGLTNLPFDVPHLAIEACEAPAHTRIGWFRSVYNLPHAFSVQSFVAELAAAAGRDHRDYLLELIGAARQIDPRSLGLSTNYGEDPERYPIDTGRLRRVIERVTEAADWGRARGPRRGLGLAAHYSFCTYVAAVLEVEVDAAGAVRVHEAWMSVDAGPVVHPDRVRAQMEGACVMGIGLALHGGIRFAEGRVVQGNFHDAPIARLGDTPAAITVDLVPAASGTELGGVGEPGLPPIAPALCNAIFAASGVRVRELPVGPVRRA